MKTCPWCADFDRTATPIGFSHRMCVECDARLNPRPARYVVRLWNPAVYLAANHKWLVEERHATRFETRQQAETAMTDLGFPRTDFFVEIANDGIPTVSK